MRTVGGTGNANGDYWKQDAHRWLKRVPLQAAWLETQRQKRGLVWFAMTELHAEHNAHMPLQECLGKSWDITTGPGGNLLIYVREGLEVIGTSSDHLPKPPSKLVKHARYITRWNVRDPYTPETPWWLALEHFRSGRTADIEAAKREQATGGNAFLSRLWRVIRMGDFNSSDSDKDPRSPRGIMRSSGYVGLQRTAEEYTNRRLNTGLKYGHDTVEIEDMLIRRKADGTSLVRVAQAAKHDARDLSDHSAWFTAAFDITDPTPKAA